MGKMKAVCGLVLVCALWAIPGCWRPDLLTRRLRKNGYFSLPAPVGESPLGEIHKEFNKGRLLRYIRRTDLLANPREEPQGDLSKAQFAQLRQILPEPEDPLIFEVESGTKTYDINAEAAVIGEVAGELKKHGVLKYELDFQEPKQCYCSHDKLKKIHAVVAPDRDRGYITSGVVRVKGLRYKLYDKRGMQVKIAADEALKEKIRAKLDMEFSSDETSSLVFSKAMYIGIKVHRFWREKSGELKFEEETYYPRP